MNIQIYCGKKNFDTQKAERFFKERRIPVQMLDLKKHPLIGIVGGDQKKGAVELAHVICAQLAICSDSGVFHPQHLINIKNRDLFPVQPVFYFQDTV